MIASITMIATHIGAGDPAGHYGDHHAGDPLVIMAITMWATRGSPLRNACR
jgi:hypothetical protein